MRQFLWGVVFGAAAFYFYANYGGNLQQFRRFTLEWRDWAKQQSGHYSVGSGKK